MDDLGTPRAKFVDELRGIAKLTAFHRMMEFHEGVLKYYDHSDDQSFLVLMTFHAFWSLVGEELFFSPLVLGDYMMPVLKGDMPLSFQVERARKEYGAAPTLLVRNEYRVEEAEFRESRGTR